MVVARTDGENWPLKRIWRLLASESEAKIVSGVARIKLSLLGNQKRWIYWLDLQRW